MSLNSIKKVFISLSSIIIVLPSLFIPTILNSYSINNSSTDANIFYDISDSCFKWPVPGYSRISSYFGNRVSPTSGASSFHQGIDIPAPYGTNIIASISGTITLTRFYGSGGFTIILKNNNFEFIYHHVSPEYIVKVGDTVSSRTNHWTSWPQKCLWCSTVMFILTLMVILQMEQLLDLTFILQ